MAGWFELSKSSDGQFRFVLKAGNAETILTSELYKAKSSAQTGLRQCKTIVRRIAGSSAKKPRMASTTSSVAAPPQLEFMLN